MHRIGQSTQKLLRPAAICRDANTVGDHSGGNHPIARRKPGRKPAGDADADDAAAAGLDRRLELVDVALRCSEEDGNPWPCSHLRLKGKARNGDNRSVAHDLALQTRPTTEWKRIR